MRNIIVGELPEGASGHEWSRYTVKYRVPPEMVHTREAVEQAMFRAIHKAYDDFKAGSTSPNADTCIRTYVTAALDALLDADPHAWLPHYVGDEFEETGEVRPARVGEWFADSANGVPRKCYVGVLATKSPRRILRRTVPPLSPERAALLKVFQALNRDTDDTVVWAAIDALEAAWREGEEVMKDELYIGSTPPDEPCVQVDPNVDSSSL